MNITDYHAKLYAYELTKRCPSNSIEKLAASLTDAQVDLNPHQVDAALFAFKSPLSKGAILADEVGLGKTIEAGLVLSQKWAERKRKLLVIVPSNLRKQWSQELMDKFFLPSVIMESRSFNECIKNGNFHPFEQDKIVITSYQFAKTKESYIKRINWDLVIIDEAHRLRNVYKNSNKTGKAIKEMLEGKAKILLTATPLQNSLLELYGLVSIIDDYAFGDIKSFKNQFARAGEEGGNYFDELKSRLAPLCKRTLRRQVLEYIQYTNRIPLTQNFNTTKEEQLLYDYVTEYLQRGQLFALPSSQRHLMTLILRKLLASSTFAISKTLGSLIDKLKAILANQNVDIKREIADNFEEFEEVEDEWEEAEGTEEGKEKVYTQADYDAIKKEIADLEKYKELAESIMKNSKGEALTKALKQGFEKLKELGANEKAVIFTESRRTQEYLFNLLSENKDYDGKIIFFNGSNNDAKSIEIYKNWMKKHEGTDKITGSKTADMRAALVDYFREEASIMIATEAAAEGINLQFCSLVVNFDLPWNPQRIEQRIGRCHRYGQKVDVVVINFVNMDNEAEQRVFELLSQKFKLFEGVFGASDEVLGTLESGVDFEKRIAEIYQTCRTKEEIKAAFDNLQQELEEEINEQMKDTRTKLLENFDEEVHEKLKVSYNESNEYLDKYENMLWKLSRHRLKDIADFEDSSKIFHLNKDEWNNKEIVKGKYKLGKNADGEYHIYRIGHPLSQEIIKEYKEMELENRTIVFDYSNYPNKISDIEKLIGKKGWLKAVNLTINSFEAEDTIILLCITDDGEEVGQEECRKLFSVFGSTRNNESVLEKIDFEKLEGIYKSEEAKVIENNSQRNAEFFDSEMEKLDKWAEDVKTSLEIELKELDKEIKTLKTEAKKISKLEDKLAMQRNIKDMEAKRNTIRFNLYKSQDEVEEKKENIISEVEERLKQRIEKKELFVIRWEVV